MRKESITTTCQICGRPIRTNNGVIAHHGYSRPGWGYQTASCRGARQVPYEKSCSIIPIVIKELSGWLKHQENCLAILMSNPPAELTKFTGRGVGAKTIAVPRPANFNPYSINHTYLRDSYDSIFFNAQYELEQKIKYGQDNLIYLQQRLADWKPAE